MRALFARVPTLARTLSHVDLGVRETPVERWEVDGTTLLAKRDDVSAPGLGGNKVRALELLLSGVGRSHTLLTVGPTGSTHALSVAHYGAQLGAVTDVITWPQESHVVAGATAARLAGLARVVAARSPVEAYLRAAARRLRGDIRWIPAGGSTPLGALGHASAALELIEQLRRDGLPVPRTIVAPLGSGGTVAGLLVGLSLANVPTRLVGVRVVPRIIGNRRHVLRLARRAHALLGRLAGVELPALQESLLDIDQAAYGGAYGRETSDARRAAELLRASGGPQLDGTYSAKAFGSALAEARRATDGEVLFWLTFDGRWLGASDEPPRAPRPSR